VTKAGAPIHGGPGYLQLIGSRRLSTELGDLAETVNGAQGGTLKFDYSLDANGHPQNIYCRSDHYMYARYGIPIIFFTTGGHADYHQVTDEPQYIDYNRMEAVGKLVYGIAERGRESRPPRGGGQAEARPARELPAVTDTLGSSPGERRRVVDVALVDDLAVAPRLPRDLVHPVLLSVRRGVVEDPVDHGVIAFDEIRHERELERLERPVERRLTRVVLGEADCRRGNVLLHRDISA
jgi:hypothetical protein